ncbi:hypothetical protein PVAP13_6NG356700 [Panicum virgatum]|uniref:DUF7595 domain-containing protein n=1 Tax=Panicum virgatum TaxID=38727 RepID=A0A8T0R4K1_PANVG|nr:hypothetical protein PVAP13_6NG356700 [Panicum virgatum]
MPPQRRASRSHTTTAAPYAEAGLCLSRCHRRRKKANLDVPGEDGAPVGILPDDALAAIFSRVPSGDTGVARCVATCRRWGRVALRRIIPYFLPHLALGILHGPEDGGGRTARARRKIAATTGSAQPRLIPMASASLRLDLDGDLFDFARPVASRNGRVVFELRREARADGLTLCVCNPVTGDVPVLPPLAGEDCPGYYACEILTRDDLDVTVAPLPPRCTLGFFRILLVYNRRGFTALRCYSSDASCWGPEGRKPGAKISSRMLQQLGPAAVLRGVAYWPMHRAAFGVRLDGAAATMDVCWVPYKTSHFLPDFRLLGVSPDGELSYVCVGRTRRRHLAIIVETLQLQSVDDDMSTVADRWERQGFIRLPQFEVPGATALKLRWFGEKSGMLLFTIGEGGNTSSAFALNLATRSVEKLADGVECNSWRNLCGYEMDRATLLRSLARPAACEVL